MGTVKVVIGNHGSGAHVEDILTTFSAGLEALGIRCDLEREPLPGCVNLLLENFGRRITSEIETLRGSARFIVVATEVVTGDTFNHFELSPPRRGLTRALARLPHSRRRPDEGREGEPIHYYYDDRSRWKKRFDRFVRVARIADAVWCMSERQVGGYRAIPGLPPVGHLELGWIERASVIAHRANNAKDIDFLFTGTPTSYRNEILAALRSRGYRVESLTQHSPRYLRENLVSRARICLNLKQSAGWAHNSVMRVHYHVMNRSLLITERAPSDETLLDYCISCDSAELLDKCAEVHAAGSYNERAAAFYEKYQAKTSLARNLGKLIAHTVDRPL